MKYLLVSLFIIGGASSGHAVSIPCLNAKGGTWDFGSAPTGCNVVTLQTPASVKTEYGPLILRESGLDGDARAAYMSQMYPVLRELARFYLLRRNPKASTGEQEGFIKALFTVANQETFWTHYRVGSDEIIRYMRGDSLHGFGLMQIDDRFHLVAIKDGKGVDLVENIVYGLDIFYPGWVKSATARCVSSSSNYKDRARAAWAVYNGGSICRWPGARSSTGDGQFNLKYGQQNWTHLVANPSAPASINIQCLVDGVRPCATGGAGVPVPKKQAPVLVDAPAVRLKAGISYRFLRACGGVGCRYVHGVIRSGDLVRVPAMQGQDWVQVQAESDGHFGWIKRADLAE